MSNVGSTVLPQFDLNSCIRVPPPPFVAPNNTNTNNNATSGTTATNTMPTTMNRSYEELRAKLDAIQRKHLEKHIQMDDPYESSWASYSPSPSPSSRSGLTSPSSAAATATSRTLFGENRLSSSPPPPIASASPNLNRRTIDGIDLTDRAALNALSLSSVQRLHDALRSQILNEMTIELNHSQERFDQVLKQGYEELDRSHERRRRCIEEEEKSKNHPDQHEEEKNAMTLLTSPAHSASSSLIPSPHSHMPPSLSFVSRDPSSTSSIGVASPSSQSSSSSQLGSSNGSNLHSFTRPKHLHVNVVTHRDGDMMMISPPLSTHLYRKQPSSSSTPGSNRSTSSNVSNHGPNTTTTSILRKTPQSISQLSSPRFSSSTPSTTTGTATSTGGVVSNRSMMFEFSDPPRIRSPIYGAGVGGGHRFERAIIDGSSSTNTSTLTSPSTTTPATNTRAHTPNAHVSNVLTPNRPPAGQIRMARSNSRDHTIPLHTTRSRSPSMNRMIDSNRNGTITTPSVPSSIASSSHTRLHVPTPRIVSSPHTPSSMNNTHLVNRPPTAMLTNGMASSPSTRSISPSIIPPSPSPPTHAHAQTPSSAGRRRQYGYTNSYAPNSSPQTPAAAHTIQPQLMYAYPVSTEPNTPVSGQYFYAIPASLGNGGIAPATPMSSVGGGVGGVPFSPAAFYLTPVAAAPNNVIPPSHSPPTSVMFNFNLSQPLHTPQPPPTPATTVGSPASESSTAVTPTPPPPQHQSNGQLSTPAWRHQHRHHHVYSPSQAPLSRPHSESIPKRPQPPPPSTSTLTGELERSRTAGFIPNTKASNGTTPTSSARIKRIRTIDSNPSVAIETSPKVWPLSGASPLPPTTSPSPSSSSATLPTSGAPLQLGNWTGQSLMLPHVSMAGSTAGPATVRIPVAAAVAAGNHHTITNRNDSNRSSTYRSSSSSLTPSSFQHDRTTRNRTNIGSSTSTSNGTNKITTRRDGIIKPGGTTTSNKFHTTNRTSELKNRKEKQLKHTTKTNINTTNNNPPNPAIAIRESIPTRPDPSRVRPSLHLDMPSASRAPPQWLDGDMQAIAEGDESAAAALSARLVALGSAPNIVAANGKSPSLAANRRAGSQIFASPVLHPPRTILPHTPTNRYEYADSPSSSYEIEEEPELAGLEHQTIPLPPPKGFNPFDDDSEDTEEDQSIQEEEHIRT